MSLPTKLLEEFDKTMSKSGYTDRSKALQTAMYSFINNFEWNKDNGDEKSDKQMGTGAIIMLYDNHIYNQDEKSIHVQHKYNEIIRATTHIHLKDDNCLETIMFEGNKKIVKDLTKELSENRGIKSIEVHYVSLV